MDKYFMIPPNPFDPLYQDSWTFAIKITIHGQERPSDRAIKKALHAAVNHANFPKEPNA